MKEECPIRDLLQQMAALIRLLERILDHCERCLEREK